MLTVEVSILECKTLVGTLLTNKTDVLSRRTFERGFTSQLMIHIGRPLTRQETVEVEAINSFKNNNATDLDGIQLELLRYGGDILIAGTMHKRMEQIWNTGHLPEQWL